MEMVLANCKDPFSLLVVPFITVATAAYLDPCELYDRQYGILQG